MCRRYAGKSRVKLLLLLSALLSALSGMSDAARGSAPSQAVSRGVAAAAAAAVRLRGQTTLPVQTVPDLKAISVFGAMEPVATIIVEPLFASRRRE